MDLLIKLYKLPPVEPEVAELDSRNIVVRRAMAYERSRVVAWIDATFNPLWADEGRVAFGRNPIGCFIAQEGAEYIGFCCLDTTYRNFVGPIGVAASRRGSGIGRVLLLAALGQMRADGYAYAVVGDAGAPEFFEKAAGAVSIDGSTPGPYPPGSKGKKQAK